MIAENQQPLQQARQALGRLEYDFSEEVSHAKSISCSSNSRNCLRHLSSSSAVVMLRLLSVGSLILDLSEPIHLF